MKILYLTARFPYPPHRGDRLIGFGLLPALSVRHRVTLVSFLDGTEPAEAMGEVGRHCTRVETVRLAPSQSWAQAWAGLFSTVPSQVNYYRSGRMRNLVAQLLRDEHFDVIFVQMVRMAPYVSGHIHRCKLLYLTDSIGLNLARAAQYGPWWRRPGVQWEQRRVARYEVSMARHFREAWVVSEVDRDDLINRGCDNVVAVPHGVDDRLFQVDPDRNSPPDVLFLGNLSVPHNIDAAVFAAREVMPRVRRVRPDAHLRLVGADPSPIVRELARIDGVEVTGGVPDLVPIWRKSRVLLAPIRFSSGIQNKVLEAMAACVPVVTTPAIAQSLRTVDGDLLRVGADAESLARLVVQELDRPEGSSEMVARARRHVREYCSWTALALRIEEAAQKAEAPR